MSADSWDICPSCAAQAETMKEAQQRAVMDAYGNVPIEKFDLIRAVAEVPLDREQFRTFREEYEFWIKDAVVKYSYSGHCSVCGSGVDFEGTQPIKITPPPEWEEA